MVMRLPIFATAIRMPMALLMPLNLHRIPMAIKLLTIWTATPTPTALTTVLKAQ